MTDDTITNPAPGWYTDPAGEADHRWWDGNAWTTQTRTAAPTPVLTPPPLPAPVAQAAPQVVVQTATLPAVRPQPRNPAAAVGLILGAASIVIPGLLLSIAAFIVSGIGLSRARRHEGLGDWPVGRKAARWGITLGILGLLVTGAVGVYGAGQLGYGPLAVPSAADKAHFLANVRDKAKPKVDFSDARLFKIGNDVCKAARDGGGRLALVGLVLDSGTTAYNVGVIGGSAGMYLCKDQGKAIDELFQ